MAWMVIVWLVALLALACWSLVFWLAAQVWAIVAQQPWPQALEQLKDLRLPDWLAPWIGDVWGEWVVAAEPWLKFAAEQLRGASGVLDGFVQLLLWAGWGFGAALLLLAALLASGLVWWGTRRAAPSVTGAAAPSA
jgi:hypothetical protein